MPKIKRDGSSRKSRDSLRRRTPDLGYYIIITDADHTEENYILGLRDSLPRELQGRIVIKVEHARLFDLVEKAKTLASFEPQYAEPWIVFDRDEVVGFDEKIIEAENAGIHAAWSNPCLEIWFDAYFGTMHNYPDSVTCCREFGRTFEKKTGHKYEKNDRQIYKTLEKYGDEESAIQTAANQMNQHARNGRRKPSEMCPGTTVYKLVEEIRKKTDR